MNIDVAGSINSGQVFLWDRYGDTWYGINGQNVLAVGRSGRTRSYLGTGTDFFRRRDDMGGILESISRDGRVKRAVKRYPGLRILDQDPFQCLISFIISSNSNIQKIRSCLGRLVQRLGEKVEFEGRVFSLFPDADRIAGATAGEIQGCGVGYRAGFVRDAARMVRDGRLDIEEIKKADYYDAMEAILSVPGVGNKVADCVMLFSLDKLDAFPLDRWMLRILEKYRDRFKPDTKTITRRQYEMLHEKLVGYFGPYAGYAQQFLFKMERDDYQKGWL